MQHWHWRQKQNPSKGYHGICIHYQVLRITAPDTWFEYLNQQQLKMIHPKLVS